MPSHLSSRSARGTASGRSTAHTQTLALTACSANTPAGSETEANIVDAVQNRRIHTAGRCVDGKAVPDLMRLTLSAVWG